MEKRLEELPAEHARLQKQIEHHQHQQQRLQNRKDYYESGDRRKRAHRLITRGAAIECIIPEIKPVSEAKFYEIMEDVFAMPEVNNLIKQAVTRVTLNAARACGLSPDDTQAASGA